MYTLNTSWINYNLYNVHILFISDEFRVSEFVGLVCRVVWIDILPLRSLTGCHGDQMEESDEKKDTRPQNALQRLSVHVASSVD